MKKNVLILMILTILSKIFGFVRDITLSYYYGASDISDAYLISLSIPFVIFGFIGIGMYTTYILIYSNIQQKYGEAEANKLTSSIINTLIIISTIIVIFGLMFTEQIVKLFASGFKGETLSLAVQFTKISLFGIYITGIIYIFNGFLQIKGNYIIPALIGFPLNIITIAAIIISSKTNVFMLSIGSVIAAASQIFLLMPFIYKEGYKHKFALNEKSYHIKKMIHMAIPIIIGVSVNEINAFADRTPASSIAIGGISALNYSNKLIGFIQGLFVTSIVTVMYPMISKMVAENNIKKLKKTILEAINLINLLVIPSTVGAMLFAGPIVNLLFGRGAFDMQAISMTSSALFYYSIGMIGFGLREVLIRVFYTFQDSKTPMVNGIAAIIVNISLNLIFSKHIGIGGLALATSVSAISSTVLLFIRLRKKIGSFGIKDIIISFIRYL